MSDSPDFGSFSPAERRAALLQLTRDVLAGGAPKTYPPKKDGTAKSVPPGGAVFAAACWAKRRLSAIEFAIQPEDGREAPAEGGAANDTPF